MTAAWFLGATTSTPQDEASVRSTLEPVRHDSTSAELQSAPEWNSPETDDSGELTGLSPRAVGSDTRDTVKYTPHWLDLASGASANHNRIIDDQVATSGTAAARERAGQQGHGTMQYAVGIEPHIRDGAAFGNDYFQRDPADIQEGAGAYMSPGQTDSWAHAVAADRAKTASREAYLSTQYAQLLRG